MPFRTCLKKLGGPNFRRKIETCLRIGGLREYLLSPKLYSSRLCLKMPS